MGNRSCSHGLQPTFHAGTEVIEMRAEARDHIERCLLNVSGELRLGR